MNGFLHSGEDEAEGEHGAAHRAGAHHHKPGGRPAKPLCKNFGQLPRLTGEWVDHPDPQYRGMYSQVGAHSTSDRRLMTVGRQRQDRRCVSKLQLQSNPVIRKHFCTFYGSLSLSRPF